MTALDEPGLRRWLTAELAERLRTPEQDIDVHRPLEEYGLQSRDAVVLSGMLEDLLDRSLDPTLVFRYPTVATIAEFLARPQSAASKAPDPAATAGDASPAAAREAIAIVGLGCRFPGGVDSPEAFWELLISGRDGLGELPPGRWQIDPPLAVPTRGGFLDAVAGFDAAHFQIPPHEAAAIDPQQRLLLEVAWEALEHAGVPPRSLEGTETGVFVGASTLDYGYLSMADPEAVEAWTGTGSSLGVIANRLSYLLGLEGPSMVVDTACSASLVAVHLAARSLLAGECRLAVAGGVNLMLHPAVTMAFENAGMLAPDGRCKTFDAAADGFVRGEGCGVVVLKRLSHALADGDRILATMLGSAVNQDGRSNGLTAPNPRSQAKLLRRAYADAGIDPGSVGYVEAHGTGTELGDPIEAGALGEVLSVRDAAAGPCLVGSVKTNLGHLEAAAGIAGLIKTVLALWRAEVPPSLHFGSPNPHIPFDELRLRVAVERMPWPGSGERPRRAVVSAYGFAGTIAHVLLEEAPAGAPGDPAEGGRAEPQAAVFPLSAGSEAAVRAAAERLAGWLKGPGRTVPLADVGHTLALRRSHERVRLTVVARDRAELIEALGGEPKIGVARADVRAPVWVFSGQGSQWVGMGREPHAGEAAFRKVIEELEPVVKAESGFSLTEVLERADETAAHGIDVIQPTVFATQLGLAAVWRDHGVAPGAVIGHSMGEVAAAVVAGALSPADGARVICRRSRLLAGVAGRGAMAAVEAPEPEVTALIDEVGLSAAVTVAVIAGPGSAVVSGGTASVRRLLALLGERGIEAREVEVDVASHSPQMDPLLEPLVERLDGLSPGRPKIAFYSTVSGDPRADAVFDGRYWAANLRRPVRLADAVSAAAEDGHEVFIEVSPHPVLTRAVASTLEASGAGDPLVLPTVHREFGLRRTLLAGLGALHRAGLPIGWDRLFPGGRPADPPTISWDRRPYWIDTPSPGPSARTGRSPAGWLYHLTWQPEPLPQRVAGRQGRWLLLADRGGTAEALQRQLVAAGTRATVVPAERLDEIGPLDGIGTVVHCGALDADGHAGDDPERAQRLAAEVSRLIRRLTEAGRPPALWLVTRFAQAVGGEPRINPAQATVWGIGRCLAVEHPELWGGLIDLDDADPAAAAALVLMEAGAAAEQQVAHRAGIRYSARVRRTQPPAPNDRAFIPEGSHLVVGGTGRIGPHLLGHLADRGVRHLVVVSRKGLRGASATKAAALRERGVTVTDIAADVADEREMATVFARFGADLPPLRGVYQAAVEGNLATVTELDEAGIAAMFSAKVTGTAVLDRLTAGHPVRTFLCVSSTTALLGSRMLAHYAAANCFAEAIAHARAARGLPARTLNWGPWYDGHGDGPHREIIEQSGMRLMPAALAIAALDHLLDGAGTQLMVADVDWPQLYEAYSARTALPIVADLVPRALVAPEPVRPAGSGRTVEAEDRRTWVQEQIGAIVAKVLKFSGPAGLDPRQNFYELGLDSLMGVVVRKRIAKRIGCTLAAKALFQYPSVAELTEHALEVLDRTAPNNPETTEPT
ncbi:MAG: SDR family NAD(P)-dependent oxidoreductase [Pseudonocardiaceae bacterium]